MGMLKRETIDANNKISQKKWAKFLDCWEDEFTLRTRQMAEEMFYSFCHDEEQWEDEEKPDISQHYPYGGAYFRYGDFTW